MATRRGGEAKRWLDALYGRGASAGADDARLIGQFLERPGAEAEAAFEALVRRHGPMVLAVCRGVLRDGHDAEDAFQATFLVLARRAEGVRDRERLAHWLGRVAKRIALRAKRAAARRGEVGWDAGALPEAEGSAVDPVACEAAALVRAEVDRLPGDDRLLMRLTYWQGKTYEEAADALSWPVGTVRSRLSRARARLRGRLARLGLAPAVAAAFGRRAEAAVRPSDALVARTVRAAARHAGGLSAAGGVGAVPASVAALVDGELTMTTVFPWKSVAALMLVGGVSVAGVASRGRKATEDSPRAVAQVDAPKAEKKPPAAEKGEKARGASILSNGGVEEGKGDAPKGWSQGGEVPGVEYVWDRGEGHGGKASLALKKTAKRFFPIAEWSQQVERTGDAPRLKVSAWVKADNLTKAILDAQFFDETKQWSHAWVAYIGRKEVGGAPISHGWTRYEGVVAIPPGTKTIAVAPQIYGPGSVWFDDVEASYTDEPATDPVAK